MSAMNCEAEKRGRRAMAAPEARAGSTMALRALPWNSGMAL